MLRTGMVHCIEASPFMSECHSIDTQIWGHSLYKMYIHLRGWNLTKECWHSTPKHAMLFWRADYTRSHNLGMGGLGNWSSSCMTQNTTDLLWARICLVCSTHDSSVRGWNLNQAWQLFSISRCGSGFPWAICCACSKTKYILFGSTHDC